MQTDYEIVSLDHEQILCKNQIKIKKSASASFEQFVVNLVS